MSPASVTSVSWVVALESNCAGHRLAGVRRSPAQAGVLGLAARHQGLQAANVHGVNRHVGPHRGVGRGTQLRLVFNSGAVHAAGEINQRFLLIDRCQLVGDRAQGLQPAIGVEDVVLGIVHGERPAGLGCAFGRAGAAFFEARAGARIEGLQRFLQQRAIGSEILIHAERVAQRDHGDQVGRHHLLVHIVLRRGGGLVDFIRLHGAEIEKQDDEPAVFQRPGCQSVELRRLPCGWAGRSNGGFGRRGREHGVGIFQIEREHLLRLVVFEHGEVFALQVAHRIAIPVAHGHVHQHQFGLGIEMCIRWTFPAK